METFCCKTKIYAGAGALESLGQLGAKRLFLVTDPFFAQSPWPQKIAKLSQAEAVEIFSRVSPDPSVELAAEGTAELRSFAPDTVVALENEIFGKPEDREDAIRMITALSGRTHKVYTAFAIRHDGKVYAEAVATEVTFRPLTEKEIAYYVDREQPYDKAGAYAIQEMAGIFVEALSGNFDNVVGLPLCQLELALKREFGISLFDFVE